MPLSVCTHAEVLLLTCACVCRDWVEEFEGFRTEFRRTSNALEVRIDASEGDVMKECYEQVSLASEPNHL